MYLVERPEMSVETRISLTDGAQVGASATQ